MVVYTADGFFASKMRRECARFTSRAALKNPALNIHARGHFLLFDKRSVPSYADSTGVRLLLIAVAVEALRLIAR